MSTRHARARPRSNRAFPSGFPMTVPPPPENMSRKQILDAIRRGASLEGVDLRGVDLSGIAFDNLDMRDAKLAEANCTRCSFRNSNLAGASMWHANLKDAILDGANLENADLDFANLDGVSLKGAKIKKTIFPLKGEKIEQIREAAKSGRKLRMDTKGLEEDG